MPAARPTTCSRAVPPKVTRRTRSRSSPGGESSSRRCAAAPAWRAAPGSSCPTPPARSRSSPSTTGISTCATTRRRTLPTSAASCSPGATTAPAGSISSRCSRGPVPTRMCHDAERCPRPQHVGPHEERIQQQTSQATGTDHAVGQPNPAVWRRQAGAGASSRGTTAFCDRTATRRQSCTYDVSPMLTEQQLAIVRSAPGSNRMARAMGLTQVTQTTLADAIGLSQPYVSDVIRGRYKNDHRREREEVRRLLRVLHRRSVPRMLMAGWLRKDLQPQRRPGPTALMLLPGNRSAIATVKATAEQTERAPKPPADSAGSACN